MGDPVRELPRVFSGALPLGFTHGMPFCPGCLVVEGPRFGDEPGAAARLAAADLPDWPLVVLVDDARQACRSSINFLWTTFTRFEPAADIHSAQTRIVRNQVVRSGSVVIDARKKPGYPAELFTDPGTAELVTRRWKEYFPKGQEMGDSDKGHLD
jgi:hypothetical protein